MNFGIGPTNFFGNIRVEPSVTIYPELATFRRLTVPAGKTVLRERLKCRSEAWTFAGKLKDTYEQGTQENPGSQGLRHVAYRRHRSRGPWTKALHLRPPYSPSSHQRSTRTPTFSKIHNQCRGKADRRYDAARNCWRSQGSRD